MRIQKLEIIGFKSFVDRTVLRFDQEVTAIVGPNGCGKSNVVDAIKWAMGEQSAQRLRGKSMDDVIFNGSESRGPHGYAEVTVTFENKDGLAPVEYNDYPEISITRRLDRQGNSDYLINRTPVRLMDITNLFLGTGVGRRAYSIIEQGRIGYIVSSKPADRRSMIEEAAGITKFKARKRAAERKMDQTRQNLLRVSDIVQELDRNLASLQRQAKKAERYRAYRGEVRDLELYLASHRYLELSGEAKVIGATLTRSQSDTDESRARLVKHEASVESGRVELQQRESAVEHAQHKAYELDNRTKMLEAGIRQREERREGLKNKERLAERELASLHEQSAALVSERAAVIERLSTHEEEEASASHVLREAQDEFSLRRSSAGEAEESVRNARARTSEAGVRITRAETVLKSFARQRQEISERDGKLRTEHQGEEESAARLDDSAKDVAARLVGLRSGQQQTSARRGELEAELKGYREQIEVSDKALSALQAEMNDKRARHRSLQELLAKLEGVGAGVKAVMEHFAPDSERGETAGVRGLVMDRLDCAEEYTLPLAVALGEQLQHVVVDSTQRALPVLSFLREGKHGRVSLLPRRAKRVVEPNLELPQVEGLVGRLSSFVSVSEEDREWMEGMLQGVILVDDLHAAYMVQAQGREGLSVVTRAGELLSAGGTLTGGVSEDVGAHLLSLKRELRTLTSVVADTEKRLQEAQAKHRTLRTAIVERKAAIEGARTEAHGAEIAIVTAEKDARRLEAERAQALRRIASIDAEIATLAMRLNEAGQEERTAEEEIRDAQARRAEATEALESAERVHRERLGAVEEQGARVTEVRVRAAQAHERAEGDRGAIKRLDQSMQEFSEREERLTADVASGVDQQSTIEEELQSSNQQLQETVGEALVARDALGVVREAYESARGELAEHEVQLRDLRSAIDAKSARLNELTLQQRELELDVLRLTEQVQERHDVDVKTTLIDYHNRPLPDASVQARADELRRLIARMGQINLLAIEEYEEKSTRFEYLSSQKVDLEQALAQLDRAIRKMNRESRKLFREAFEAVNLRFKKVFPQLFAGGKAELKLTNPDDLLDTGLDIVAQPPGKRLGSLELMSGGEKALTAVALILAIFQYKPSPFCLLDEVDAPLDEANVGRYANAIRQMTDRSQFIVITHSKRTMEFADMLYGVTMAEPGISNLVSVALKETSKKLESSTTDSQTAAVA